MEGMDFSQMVQHWGNFILVWIGFGTLAGLIAKAVLPGRDPGGTIATLATGIGGSIIGSGVLLYFWEGARVSPISVPGLVVAVAGAFVLLFFYRLLSGHFFKEAGTQTPHVVHQRRTRKSRRMTVVHQ